MKEKRTPKRRKVLAKRAFVAVRIPENLAGQINFYCRLKKISTSDFIRQAMHSELERLRSV